MQVIGEFRGRELLDAGHCADLFTQAVLIRTSNKKYVVYETDLGGRHVLVERVDDLPLRPI